MWFLLCQMPPISFNLLWCASASTVHQCAELELTNNNNARVCNGFIKDVWGNKSHNMLMATTKPNAAMYAAPLEYIARQIAWTTHFFNHSHIFSPDISDPSLSKHYETATKASMNWLLWGASETKQNTAHIHCSMANFQNSGVRMNHEIKFLTSSLRVNALQLHTKLYRGV